MKRRDFALQITGLGLALTAHSQGGPVEGQQYARVSPPAPSSLPPDKKIEVIEFFWYECPHCFAFDPAVQAWSRKLPADVLFRRVPVGFSARYQQTQKLFYALENLGVLGALHSRVFDAIHRQNQHLLSEGEMLAFVSANGVDGAKFSEMFRSFQVSTQATKASQLSDAYKIDGVPMMGVNGRWTTSGSMAGTNERSLAVVDFLIERSRKAV